MADIDTVISEDGEVQGFVFYKSFLEGIDELDDDEQLMMYRALSHYGIYGEEPNLKGVYKSYFHQMKTSISNAQKRYKNSVINGSSGGAPEGNNNASKGKTCRKCCHRKSCKICGHINPEYCPNFELPKTSQFNPEQPNSTQNYPNINNNINMNTNSNMNVNNNLSSFDDFPEDDSNKRYEDRNNDYYNLSADMPPYDQIPF